MPSSCADGWPSYQSEKEKCALQRCYLQLWDQKGLSRNRQQPLNRFPTILYTRSISLIEVEVLPINDAEVSQKKVALVVDEAHCVSRWQITLMHVINTCIYLFKQAWNVAHYNIIHVRKLCCEFFLTCVNWTSCYNIQLSCNYIQLSTHILFHLYVHVHYTDVYWLVNCVSLNELVSWLSEEMV